MPQEHLEETVQHLDVGAVRTLVTAGRDVFEGRQIGACRKVAAGAGEDHSTNRRVSGRRFEGGGQLLHHRRGQRVGALGIVERENNDGSVALLEY